MDARRTLTLLALGLVLMLLAGCAPDGWPREAAAPTPPGEPTAAPTGEELPYPPPPNMVTPAPTDSDTGYPVYPTPTGLPSRTPTPTRTPVVTPTAIPLPTPLPTPVVTPIPVAEPPLIPEAAGREPEVFTLVYRAGDTVRAVQSDGTGDRLLVDPYAATGWHLAGDGVQVNPWQQGGPSPDGRTLALVLSNVQRREDLPKGESPALRIDLFDLETGESRALVADAVEPVWSPGGTRLAYRDWATGGLWVLEVATGEAREVYATASMPGGDHHVTMMDWSPDGRSIVFVDMVFRQSQQMIVVSLDAIDHPTVLTAVDENWPSFPRWSPVGDRIVYSDSVGAASSSVPFYNLWAVRPDRSDRTQLTHDIDVLRSRWSPDGHWIAFSGYAAHEPGASWDLWLLDPDGIELKRLTWTPEDSEDLPIWSPDGMHLIALRIPAGGTERVVWTLSLVDGTYGPISAGDAEALVVQQGVFAGVQPR